MVFVSLLVLVLIILHVLIVYEKSPGFCADQRIINGEIRFSRLGLQRVTVVCTTESSLSGSTVWYRSADCTSAVRFAALIVRLENHCIPDFVLTEASRSLKTDSTGAALYIPHRRTSAVDEVTGEPRLSMTSRPDIRTLSSGQEHVILSTSSPDRIVLEPVTSFLNRLIVGRVQPPPLETILTTAGHYQTNGISLSDGRAVRLYSSITEGDEFTVIERRFVVDDSEKIFSNDCVICQETLGTTVFTQLPCRHAFHSKCITDWLTVRRNCPTCRYSLIRKQV